MILDFNIELEQLESQPEWIGVDQKIKELVKEKEWLVHKFEKDPKEWINKRLNELEKDIDLFKSILAFWGINHEKMKHFKKLFEEHSTDINERQDLLQLVEDQKMIIKHDIELIEMDAMIFRDILKRKDISEGLIKLKNKVNEYFKKLK